MRSNYSIRRYAFITLALCSLVSLPACSLLGIQDLNTRQRHNASSVVDFLYPNRDNVAEKSGIPILSLPLHVGIAFVPPNSNLRRGNDTLTESRKMELMNQIAAHFKQYAYVKDIELIPTAYLRAGGGFENLDQIRTMHGVDVVALVSYDQMQFTDQNFLSFSYLTIVGAFVVRGEKNDTQTMLDTVVYDIASRKMLFRAPGTNHIKGSATLINLTEQLRKDSETGLDEATKSMIENLDLQLASFKDRVKERPEEYRVVRTAGYKGPVGGGSIDAEMLALLAALTGGLLWTRRRA